MSKKQRERYPPDRLGDDVIQCPAKIARNLWETFVNVANVAGRSASSHLRRLVRMENRGEFVALKRKRDIAVVRCAQYRNERNVALRQLASARAKIKAMKAKIEPPADLARCMEGPE